MAGEAGSDDARGHGGPGLEHIPVGVPLDFDPGGVVGWDIFPFRSDDLEVIPLRPPELPEPARGGEGGVDCGGCEWPHPRAIWHDDDWYVTHFGSPSAIPVAVSLSPRRHHDANDLSDDLAASLGPLLVRMTRAVESVQGVGRAHWNKWGDGGAHLHVVFFGRPAGLMQTRGSCLDLWEDILPPMPMALWQAHMVAVATAMAEGGGTAMATGPWE